MADDPKISQRYRELAREEPPRHVDEAILAAARRAAKTRPAPLVVPSGRQRWYFPLAAAAIIVLAVAVTIHVEREQPDPEAVVPVVTAPKVPTEEKLAQPESRAAPPEVFVPDPKPAPSQEQRDAAPLADLQKAQKAPSSPESGIRESVRPDVDSRAKALGEMQQAPAPAPPAAAARAPAPAAKSGPRAEQRAMDVARARAATGSFAHALPEQWLQGIADLRRQGRHEEADKALAEFRKRYPDYKIPEAVLETLEKRAK